MREINIKFSAKEMLWMPKTFFSKAEYASLMLFLPLSSVSQALSPSYILAFRALRTLLLGLRLCRWDSRLRESSLLVSFIAFISEWKLRLMMMVLGRFSCS